MPLAGLRGATSRFSTEAPPPDPYSVAEALLDPGGAYERTWRCEDPDCDGRPHVGWAVKHARGSQVVPEDEQIFYLVGGRGSGKTWAGAHNFAQLILDTEPDDGDDHTEWAVLAPTYRDARDVCIEGPSGLLKALRYKKPGDLVERWDRSMGKLVLTNGAVVWVDGVSEGAERVQGKNLYGAWCDEVGLWRKWLRAWYESLLPALRKGRARVIATGTPKRRSLAKALLDDPKVGRRRLRTVDNLANLAKHAIDALIARYGDTALGQQELEGILVNDVDGALWKRDRIHANRIDEHFDEETERTYWLRQDGTEWRWPPFWTRIIVALDPSDGDEDSDEQGIAVVAQSPDDHELYLLHSDGVRLSPWDYLVHAVELAVSYQGQANLVELVVEKNHGGKFLLGLIDQVIKDRGVTLAYRSVDASEGKRTRAEDVSGLYERDKVHHVGLFAELEDQQCTWTGLGREPSPDRMDALVWALKQFVADIFGPTPQGADAVHQWSDSKAEGVFGWDE